MLQILTTTIDARRAAVLVLAVAADDREQMSQIFQECATSPDDMAVLKLCLELASVSVDLAEQHAGPYWRSAMGSAIVDLELGKAQDLPA